MNGERFREITSRYTRLKLAILGDFCLDRYLEIDPSKQETSIETGLPVHNVVQVRAQPGGAGTILNNLSALGIGTLFPIGFTGEDGEGYELRRALAAVRGVNLDGVISTNLRRTFTYCKPLLMHADRPPEELSRLDSKNWSVTPAELEKEILLRLEAVFEEIDALIVLDQVDVPDTGVVTRGVLEGLAKLGASAPARLILADSRRTLKDFPKVVFKMNAAELCRLTASGPCPGVEAVMAQAGEWARRNRQMVFVTMAEQGIVGADPFGNVAHQPSLPIRGPIDVVGAGDAVSANLTSALAGGATMNEALVLANCAASVVLHKLGTTGTADVSEIAALIESRL